MNQKNKGGRPKGSKTKGQEFLCQFERAAREALGKKKFSLMKELIKACYDKGVSPLKRTEFFLKLLPYCYPSYKSIETNINSLKPDSIQVLIQNSIGETGKEMLPLLPVLKELEELEITQVDEDSICKGEIGKDI